MAAYLYLASAIDSQAEYVRRNIELIRRSPYSRSWASRLLLPTTTFAEVLGEQYPSIRDATCLVVACKCVEQDAADLAEAVKEHRLIRYILCDWPVGLDFARGLAERLGDLATVVARDQAASGVERLMSAVQGAPHFGSLRSLCAAIGDGSLKLQTGETAASWW
jgi:hypothetical protein